MEEQQSRAIKLVDHGIYCIGNAKFILMFDHKASTWQKVFFDTTESDY